MKSYTYKDLAAAYVKGCALKGMMSLPEGLAQRNLDSLTDDQKDELVSYGKIAGLKMHYFKEKDELARVQLVIGFMRGIRTSFISFGCW